MLDNNLHLLLSHQSMCAFHFPIYAKNICMRYYKFYVTFLTIVDIDANVINLFSRLILRAGTLEHF